MAAKTESLLQWAGAVAVPLLLAALGVLGTATAALMSHGARDAVIEQRVATVEKAVVDQAEAAKRIEVNVVLMRVQAAEFRGAIRAQLDTK